MKKIILSTLFSVGLLATIIAQEHFEFEVTDTDGQVINLYQDLLNEGKTVVIKIFFVSCPPCNAIAKDVQALYEQWGEGEYDVEFIEVTTLTGDSDNDVKGYKALHGITFPSVSAEGGAIDVTNEYKSGYFGVYWGTPSFAVISPDGSTWYGSGSNLTTIDQRISATGAQGTNQGTTPTNVNINIAWTKDDPGDAQALDLKIVSASNPSVEYSLSGTNPSLVQFQYPNEQIPEINDPILVVNYTSNENLTRKVTASDITVMRKHILDFQPLTNPEHLIAADVNGDGKISSIDIITLRKVILGFDLAFPNNVPNYIPESNNIPIVINPGGSINIDIKMIKMGDLN